MSKEEKSNKITQYQLDDLINSIIINPSTIYFESKTRSFVDLLSKSGFLPDLSDLKLDLTNIRAEKFDLSGLDLKKTEIICKQIESLNFIAETEGVSNLYKTKVVTADTKIHYLNTNHNENKILSFVIDKEFQQGFLISKNLGMLNPEGVCFGLVVEKARWELKHYEELLAQPASSDEGKKDIIEKFYRKINNKSENFNFRIQYYWSTQDLLRSDRYKFDNLRQTLNYIGDSGQIGISFATFDQQGKRKGSHIISISKIGDKYQIFDPDYGFGFVDSAEMAIKNLEAIIYTSQKYAPESADRDMKYMDLKEYVKQNRLSHLIEIDKEENKKRKYKGKNLSYSAALWYAYSKPPSSVFSIEDTLYKEELIRRGADINCRFRKTGETPLMRAIYYGNKEGAETLIAKDVKLNIKNNRQQTALDYSMIKGYEDLTKLLVAKGAKSTINSLALIEEIQKDQPSLETFNRLLNEGGDVLFKDSNGNDLLSIAAGLGHKEITEMLIAKGAVLNIQNEYGKTALSVSMEKGYTEIAELLINRGANVNSVVFCGYCITDAIEQSEIKIAHLLIEKGADLDVQEMVVNRTPLILAIEGGHEDIVKILIDKNVNIEAIDDYGKNALIYAVEKGNKEIVRLLLNKGADVNVKDREGNSPLDYANSNLEIAALIENEQNKYAAVTKIQAQTRGFIKRNEMKPILQEAKNAKIQLLAKESAERDHELKSSLIKTILQKKDPSIEEINKLIMEGADVNMKSPSGCTPLISAIARGYIKIAKLLIENNAQINEHDNYGETALLSAIRFGHIEVAKTLIDCGADLEIQNQNGETALLSAIRLGRTEIAKALIDRGTNLETQNRDGETAVLSAIRLGRTEIAKALIDCGADLEAQNRDGETSLFSSIRLGRTEIAKALIDRGADLEAQNRDGETALSLAFESDNTEIIKMFVAKGGDIKGSLLEDVIKPVNSGVSIRSSTKGSQIR